MGISALLGTRRTLPLLGVAIAALTLAALLIAASSARGAELIYWANFEGPETIGFSSLDGSGGGAVANGSFEEPEGMAYDPVTNRLYSTAGPFNGNRAIHFVNLDGSGGGVLATPGAPVEEAEGLAVDPATRMVFWLNFGSSAEELAWARLDGSGGGVLNTGTATLEGAIRLALDPVAGRLFWSNENGTIGFANVNNTGGGTLDTTGAPAFNENNGLAVDNASGRLYWINTESDGIDFASLNGGGGGEVEIGTAPFERPFGLAIEPGLNRLYWGNFGNETERTEALGFASFSGGGGGITPAIAPVDNPQDPVIIKSPTSAGAPQVTQAQAQLSCSQGSWAADASGANFFQSPHSFSYQWSLNGAAISGATASTFTATAPGSYSCTVTATNQAGSTPQASANSVTIPPSAPLATAAKLRLKVAKKTAKAKPGKKVTFKVNVSNQGGTASATGKVCLKVPNKKAKKALKPQKCATLKSLGAGAGASVKVGAAVKKGAKPGNYKATITVPGTSGIKVSVKVLGV